MTKNSNIPPQPNDNASPQELADYYEKYSDQVVGEELTEEEHKEQRKIINEALKTYKRTQLNIAMPAEELNKIKELARKKGAPVATLARMWILDRLHKEYP